MTPLDMAHATMEEGESDALRRAFWDLVAATELHLWLVGESEGEALSPQIFEIEGARYALAFDTEDRLSGFAGGISPYAAMSGRRLAGLLAASGLGLGLNFGAASQTLLPPDLVAWLAGVGGARFETVSERPIRLGRPTLGEAAVATLDRRLAAAEGMARTAWLAEATWPDDRTSHLLAVEEVVSGAAESIAHFVAEGLSFSGGAALDVMTVVAGSPLEVELAKVALRFDLPQPPELAKPDPTKPPRLR